MERYIEECREYIKHNHVYFCMIYTVGSSCIVTDSGENIDVIDLFWRKSHLITFTFSSTNTR